MSFKKESLPETLEGVKLENLADGFVSFNVPPDSVPEQVHDMRMAFLTGAYTLMCLIKRVEKEPQERASALLDGWNLELESWYAQLEAAFHGGRKV